VPKPTTSTRCVFCAANLPHARHVSQLEASQLGIAISEGTGTPDAQVTTVTPQQSAPSAPQE
jgi:hypothetical protein